MDIVFKKKKVHIANLLLDPENPRHDVLNHQPEIIKQLFENEQIVNLAKDIAKQGALSPLELVGVLPSKNGNDYIVIEGNRRICACLLLNNPELTPVKSMIKQFRQLQKNNSIPTKIECTIFDNRDDADHWMQLRHEGQQDGIGTKPWDAPQKARYSKKRGRRNPNIQSIQLLDYATDKKIIKDSNKDNYSITTLQRYLNNPVVRNVFGLKNRETLESKQSEPAFEKLVERFLKDYDEGIVNSRSKQDDWKNYANTLQKEVSDPPAAENRFVDYSEKTKKKAGNKNKQKTRSRPDPAKRKYLLPGDIKFSIKNKTLNRIYWELQRLQIEEHEFSTVYLFRAFLEGTAILYLKKYLPNALQIESKLHKKLAKVSEHLEMHQNVKPGKLKSLNTARSDKNALISPLMLGSMIHLTVIPSKRELLGIWDSMEEVLLIIHEYLD